MAENTEEELILPVDEELAPTDDDVIEESWMEKLGLSGPNKFLETMLKPEKELNVLEASGPLSTVDDIANAAMQSAVGESMSVAARGAQAVATPFLLPASGLANVVGRLADDKNDPLIMRRARAAEGFPENYEEAYEQAKKSGSWDVAKFIFNEAFPTSQGMSANIDESTWDAVSESIAEGFGFIPKVFEKAGFTPGEGSSTRPISRDIKAVLKFVTDVTSDPLLFVSAMQKVPQKGAQIAAKTAEGALKQAEQEMLRRAVQKKGFGPEISRGERNLVSLDIPFVKKIPLVKGQKVGEALDKMRSFVDSIDNRLANTTTNMGFDFLDSAHELRSSANTFAVKQVKEQIMRQAEYNSKNVNRLASYMAEAGDEQVGIALAKKRGMKLTPDDIDDARNLSKAYSSILEEGRQVVRDQSGIVVKQLELPSPELQNKILKQAQKQFGEIPVGVVELEDGRNVDVTFSKNYDYGRRLSEMSQEAKGLQLAEDEMLRAANGTPFASRPDALKQRNPLSTFMLEELYSKKYGIGIDEVFDWNKPNLVVDTYENLLKFSNDVKFLDQTKSSYGVPRNQIEEYILSAQARVEMDVANKVPPSLEDLTISKLKSTDFKPVDVRVFDRMTAIGGKDVVKIVPQDLYYPRAIADRINNRFMKPTRTQVGESLAWLQGVWSKNALTSPLRITRQGFENMYKSFGFGVTPKTFLEEVSENVKSSLGKKVSRETQIINSIPSINENLFTDVAPKGKIPFNEALKDSEKISSPYFQYLESIKNLMTNNAKAKDVISPKFWVEYIGADNPISKFVRKAGSYSDTMTKRAHMRQMLRDGYSIPDAVIETNARYMDFSRKTPGAEAVRLVSPFSSYLMKNAEAIPAIFAKRPGLTNVINPWDGHFARAFQEWSGWDQEQSKRLRRLIPFYQDDIIGPVLKGADSLMEDETWLQGFMNDWSSKWLGKSQEEKLKQGYLFSLKLPHPLTGLSGVNPAEAATSPIASAMMIGFLGYDPLRERTIKTKGTTLEGWDRIVMGLNELNPVQHPRFMNFVVAPWVRENMPKIMDTLSSPVGKEVSRIIGLRYPELKFNDDKGKIDDLTVKTLAQFKFFGLGRLTKADNTYMMRQLPLIAKFNRQVGMLDNLEVLKSKTETARTVGGLKRIASEIRENTLAYKDLLSRANGIELDQETKDILSQELVEDEQTDGIEEAPSEPDVVDVEEVNVEEDSVEEGGREPQSEARRSPKEDMEYVLSWPVEWSQQYEGKQYYDRVYEEVQKRANEVFGADVMRDPEILPALQESIKRKLNPQFIKGTYENTQQRNKRKQAEDPAFIPFDLDQEILDDAVRNPKKVASNKKTMTEPRTKDLS